MSDRICDLCTDRDYRKKAKIRSVAVQRLGRISKKRKQIGQSTISRLHYC